MRESEVVKNLNTFLLNKRLNYANEIRMGIGIPDVMIGFELNEMYPNIRNYYTLSVYNILKENDGKTFKEILAHSDYSPKEIKRTIKFLTELGVVTMDEGKTVHVKTIDFDHSGIAISIEVKVKDWKLGLLQAQRYLQFSDYSYLALPVEHIKAVDKKEVKKCGIGLLQVSENEVKELIKPKQSKKCDSLSKYISISNLKEKILKTEDTFSTTCFETTSLVWR